MRLKIAASIAACSLVFLVVAQPPGRDAASKGQALFERRCGGCHALDKDKAAPRLRTVFGRRAASVPGYPYSDSLKNAGLTWDSHTLDQWLTDPEAFVPDNDMAFRLANVEERGEIIAYLKELAGK